MIKREDVTILITSAGSASALNCINALRKQTELNVRLVAVDAYPFSAGLYEADVGYTVPLANEDHYIDTIMNICHKEGVKVILPTFSAEVPVFASHTSIFEEQSIHLLISPIKSVLTFENKWQAYQFFHQHNVLTPATWLVGKVPVAAKYPLYLKPIRGGGSRNSYRIDNEEGLAFYTRKVREPCIVQQFMEGPEFTVDIVADRNSRVIAAVPRERMRVRDGKAIVARTVSDDSFLPEVQHIVSLAGLVGPMNMQGFLTDEGFVFIDINTRFAAGGLPLAVAAGINTPLMTVKLALGLLVSPTRCYKQDLIMVRYYTEVFICKTETGGYQRAEASTASIGSSRLA